MPSSPPQGQIVLALKLYKNRGQYIDIALRRLFEIARYSTLLNNDEALEVSDFVYGKNVSIS